MVGTTPPNSPRTGGELSAGMGGVLSPSCAHWDPSAVSFTLGFPPPSSCRPNVQEALAATLVLLSGSWYQSPPLRHLHGGLGVDRGGLFLQRCPHVAHLRDIQLSGVFLGLGASEGKDNTSRQAHVCTRVGVSCSEHLVQILTQP